MQRFLSQLLITSLLLVCTVLLTSCPPDDPPPPKPILFNISTPYNRQEVHPGDTVHFKGDIATDFIGFTYRVRVLHLPTSSILYNYEAKATSQNAQIDQKWVNPVADSTELEVEFTVNRQGYGNTEAKHLTLQVVP